MSLNVVALKGRLGADPEIKHFENGSMVASWRMAVDEFINQEKGTKTHWIPVKLWGKRAETVVEHFRKGDEIAIQGRLTMETWGQGENAQSRLVVTAEDFDFCGSRKER